MQLRSFIACINLWGRGRRFDGEGPKKMIINLSLTLNVDLDPDSRNLLDPDTDSMYPDSQN